jgi:hypothetical protein
MGVAGLLMDIVAKVFNSRFRAVLTSGLNCTLEAKRRFNITDLELLKETHIAVSGAMLLNGLDHTKLKIATEHYKRSFGVDYVCSIYCEFIGPTGIRAYALRSETDREVLEAQGYFNLQRLPTGDIEWDSTTLKLANAAAGLSMEDFRSYLQYKGQPTSFMYSSSSFSNLATE